MVNAVAALGRKYRISAIVFGCLWYFEHVSLSDEQHHLAVFE
ncbi:MAG TPA: hypothetical protein VG797_01180 [Phycisphaerales bacterium]|nr:hypothetical protein [Phycisphaerales bacterium]